MAMLEQWTQPMIIDIVWKIANLILAMSSKISSVGLTKINNVDLIAVPVKISILNN